MARDPLQVVLLLRRRGVEQSREALAARLKAEQSAAAVIIALEALAEQEKQEADRLSTQEVAVLNGQMNMLSIRLNQFRRLGRQAVGALASAQQQTAEAVSRLAETRSSERIIEQLIEERRVAAQKRHDIQEGHSLDDITRHRHRLLKAKG